ncbi:hypothetical protein [Arthrobacter sp. 9AX]|uniref:hypothetical protein n=1 Tax=Arthrobacter sp. 9AX TaxID=2653131 RepID=UPI001916AACB|nr:hypothetical protein [Arthrobacter sp. 9AX]
MPAVHAVQARGLTKTPGIHAGVVTSLAVLLGITVPAEATGRAEIRLSAAAGPAGASVMVTGSGFARRSSGMLTAGSAAVPFTVGADGSFRAPVVIEPTVSAPVPVTAATGKVSASARYTVTYSSASLTARQETTADVTGFVWFHHNKEVDWRINSTTTSADTLATALAARN